MTPTKRRWGFRARLTALIAAVFASGGIVLLGVQYLLVRQLFSTAINTITSCVTDNGVDVAIVTGDAASAQECREVAAVSGVPDGAIITSTGDGYSVLVEQSTMLSQEVLSGLLVWSIVILLAFTAVAVVIASWLARRSFVRIGQITDTTKRITGADLGQRLDLPGPVDEIKELGDTIDTMLDRLEASFIQQDRFVTNASHELRTPLTTTRTALEIPLMQGQVPEKLEPAVRRALEANHRSERLIAALLDLARTTKAPPASVQVREPLELDPIIEDSIARHTSGIDAKNIIVTTSLRAGALVKVDQTLLTLVIDNLIDNAICHNVEHGTVHVASGGADGHTWLEITNSGPHLSHEEVALLTEPFNRGPQTRTAADGRGLGLGLTLVHNITTTVGARCILTPGPGDAGLRVRVELPPCQRCGPS